MDFTPLQKEKREFVVLHMNLPQVEISSANNLFSVTFQIFSEYHQEQQHEFSMKMTVSSTKFALSILLD